jgi:hypothetical protein
LQVDRVDALAVHPALSLDPGAKEPLVRVDRTR